MQIEKIRLGDRLLQLRIDKLDGARMSHDLLVVVQGLTRYGEPFLDEEFGLAQGEGIALQRRGDVGPEITELVQLGLPDIPVEANGMHGTWMYSSGEHVAIAAIARADPGPNQRL